MYVGSQGRLGNYQRGNRRKGSFGWKDGVVSSGPADGMESIEKLSIIGKCVFFGKTMQSFKCVLDCSVLKVLRNEILIYKRVVQMCYLGDSNNSSSSRSRYRCGRPNSLRTTRYSNHWNHFEYCLMCLLSGVLLSRSLKL